MTHDLDYFRRRELQERDRAALSSDDIAKRVHLEMAERYSAIVRETPAAAPAPEIRA